MTMLSSALPELRAAWDALTRGATAKGITFKLADDYAGVRTAADTIKILNFRQADYAAYVAALKKRNPSAVPLPLTGAWDSGEPRPIAPFGSSFHDYGAAFDILPVTWPPALGNRLGALNALGALAPSCGLRWGGLWPGDKIDRRHFELAIPLSEARTRWQSLTRSQAGKTLGLVLLASLGAAAWHFLARGRGFGSWT